MRSRRRWQVGSDFEWPPAAPREQDEAVTAVPWVAGHGEDVVYLESGRQALASVSGLLRAGGATDVYIPSYVCESMLTPWFADGWNVHAVRVGRHFEIEPLVSAAASPQSVILSLSYFGQPEGDDWITSLAEAQAAGATVVSDETHRVLDAALPCADYRVASLRKMLPLPDGGFLAGRDLSGVAAPDAASSAGPAAIRAHAMKEKTSWLEGAGQADFRAIFAAAESRTDARPAPARMSPDSYDILRRLDYGAMRTRRVANAAHLRAALESAQHRPLLEWSGTTPSHLVLHGPNITGLRRFLAARGVFCPIHWPRPHPVLWDVEWRHDVVSVPVDHRYGAEDMSRVAALILEFEDGR